MSAFEIGSLKRELAAIKAQVDALSRERTDHTVRTSERNEMYGSVRGVIPYKSPYHVTQDDNWNSIVVTNAIATDNATNFNLHIVNTLKTARDGTYQVAIPGGITRYYATPRLLQNAAGVEWVMGGANLSEGTTPDGSSWYNETTPTSSFFFGTEDYGIGYGSAAMVELTDVTCFRWKGGGLRGDGTDPARYGILVGKATGGLGPSTMYFEQTAIQNCDEGINVGRVATAGGGYAAENCSEVVMIQPMMKVCDYCYVTMHGQAVNHLLIQPQFNGAIAGWKQTGGGGMTMLQPVTFDIGAMVESTGGGSNTGIFLSLGARLDTAGVKNTKLWNGLDDEFNVGVFFGGGAVYNASVPTGARITAQPNHFISAYHWHNLSDAGGTKPVFESAATGAKIVSLYGVWLIPESYRSFSRSDNIGTWHTNGDWVIRDCIDNTNYVRVADAEYPRLNGRSSTHRFRCEEDFNRGDSATAVWRDVAASCSGAGATTRIVQPWAVNTVGVLSLDTGTTSGGSAACISSPLALALTGGPWRCEIRARLIVLSAATGVDPDPGGVAGSYGTKSGVTGTESDADEQFTVRLGFCDSATGDGTDGAFWRYNDAVNGGRWECVTRDGGSETATDAGVLLTNAVAQGDQDAHIFEIKVNPAGTSIAFYLDGELAATNATNLPDSTDYTGMMPGSIVKSTGTNTRSFHIDFAYYDFVPSTQRGTAHSK